MRERRLAAEEHAIHVDAEGRVPVGLRELGDRPEPAEAGVVHQEVEAAERRHRVGHHASGRLAIAHVRDDGGAAAAGGVHFPRDQRGTLPLDVVDRDRPTSPGPGGARLPGRCRSPLR